MEEAELFIEMPTEVANLKLPDPDLLTYFRNLAHREIWIDDNIGQATLEVARQIMLWNAEDAGKPKDARAPIKLFIVSNGGESTAEHCVCDVICASETPVYTINAGLAASAAASIYLCGHKRFAFKYSQFLLHNGYATLSGTADAVLSGADSYKAELKKYSRFISEHSNVKPTYAEKKLSGDWWLDVDEANKIGIVDAVVETLSDIT